MSLYCGIDLHSNNHVIVIIDEQDRVVHQARVPNEIMITMRELQPYADALVGIAVESTFNWCWLVDGLQEAGLDVHLVNTAAVKQYEGLKHSDDHHDAFHLAHLLRLGLLPTGYVYPKATRPLRDLLRRRMQLVQIRSLLLVSLQSQIWRQTGHKIPSAKLKSTRLALQAEAACTQLCWESYQQLQHSVGQQIAQLERAALQALDSDPRLALLQSVRGIGPVLAMTIALETGEIARFASGAHYASYCRCVQAQRLSNGKAKSGNKYLSWAYSEAAHFVVRFDPRAQRYFERKRRRTSGIVAIRAVAHKLARALFYVQRDQVAFDANRAFA